MKKRKIKERIELLYDNNGVKVIREKNNSLWFECDNPYFNGTFKTFDYTEAVAALMKIPNIEKDKDFWNIDIIGINCMYTAEKALYWLSGGDTDWIYYSNYNIRWNDAYEAYLNNYTDIFTDIVEGSYTLGDIRDGYINYLNLGILYEFALENDYV